LLTITLHSRQAIQKYIKANNSLGNVSDVTFKGHVNRAITSGEEKGDFSRPKGMFCTVLTDRYASVGASPQGLSHYNNIANAL
jgi:hypothetical protein